MQKKHPGWSYQTALKKAGAEYRAKGPKRKSGKPAGKKKRATSSRRSHSSGGTTVGSVGSATTAQMKSAIVREREEALAWALLARDSAKRVKERKQKAKKVAELRHKLRLAKSL